MRKDRPMVAQNDQFRRFVELRHVVESLVLRGKRDPKVVADWLQAVNDEEHLARHSSPSVSGRIWGNFAVYPKFLSEIYGITLDVSALTIPTPPSLDFFSPLVIPQGITPNRIVQGMREKQGVAFHLYTDDLDRGIPTHERDPKDGSYIILHRGGLEPDQEFAEKSADDIRAMGVRTMTLIERLLAGSFHLYLTEEHLDQSDWTRCDGSRRRDGRVPFVRWDAAYGRVYVCWWCPPDRNSFVRPRQVVSV